MIKLPEPVASRIWCPDEQNEFQYNEEGDGAPLFTEAQLKQAVRDAYEDAAKLAADYGPSRPIVSAVPSLSVRGRWEGEQAASGNIAAAIRALIKEIPDDK